MIFWVFIPAGQAYFLVHAIEMTYTVFPLGIFPLIFSCQDSWLTSDHFLYGVLIFGALLTAGVALSVLTFYEDHYWGDHEFREQLRFNSSRKEY